MKQPTVYTLGRVIVDLYANEIGVPLDEVQSFQKYLGGSSGNTAVGLARLGANTGLISRVGSDRFGEFLTQKLEVEGVDTQMVKNDPVYQTGLAFAAIFPPDDSDVLFYRKPCADGNLSIDDLDYDKLGEAKILVVACTSLAKSPGRETALAALKANKTLGGLNVLDIDWRPMFWNSIEEAKIYYDLALTLTDVVIANEPELELIGSSKDPTVAAKHVFTFGVDEVVAKRGSKGVIYFGRERGEPITVPPSPIKVLNTLGAGDAFGASYVYGLLEGWEIRKRLEFASAAAAIVVGRHSCSEAMPTKQEVEEKIASDKSL
jgi:5-dehydro-2-deoxygluconokinase